MKRALPLLMIISLFLGGCGDTERAERQLESAREQWAVTGELSFTADVRAEFTDSVFECELLTVRKGGEVCVEVLAPELVAGIRARLSGEDARLEYDGLILELGDSLSGEISPMAAMPMILDAICVGHVTRLWQESEGEKILWTAEVFISGDMYAKIWFEGENMHPVHAELVSGGRCVVKCSINSFT